MEVNLKYYSFVKAFKALESRSCTAQKAKLVSDELRKECDTDVNEKFASVIENKTGSSQVAAISRAQKYIRNNYWKYLQKIN